MLTPLGAIAPMVTKLLGLFLRSLGYASIELDVIYPKSAADYDCQGLNI